MSLGERKVLKEFQIEINESFEANGFIDLVGKGKINFEGKIKYFNDLPISESELLKKVPLKLHFKCKNFYNEDDYIDFGTTQRVTAKEYVKFFKNKKERLTGRITINTRSNEIKIIAASHPYGDDWRASVLLSNINLIEAKNVPGLPDVEEKNGEKLK
ncbi:MAG: hypothetical protein Q7K34_03345 [archaeon]|nr:hypothetical protein [archaeon]